MKRMRQCFWSPLKTGCLSKPPKTFCGMSWNIAITVFLVLAITLGVFFAVCMKNQMESISKIMAKIETARKENDKEYASLANKMKNITDELARFEKDLEAKFTIDAPKVDPFKGIQCYYHQYPGLYQGTQYTTTKSGKPCVAWSDYRKGKLNDYKFPPYEKGSLAASRNYCRVPWKKKPWCPTGPDSQEECNVPVCTDTPPVPDIDFTKEQAEELTELLNVWRKAAPSSDMLPVVWDERLQESARLASASCCYCGKLGHVPFSWHNQNTGLPWTALENGASRGRIYKRLNGGGYPLTPFYNEKPNYCIINAFPAPEHSFWDTGHYTVMLDSGFTNFACGRHFCNNTDWAATVAYCHFGGYKFRQKVAGVTPTYFGNQGGTRPFRVALDERRGITVNGNQQSIAEYKAKKGYKFRIQYDFDCADDEEELRVGEHDTD